MLNKISNFVENIRLETTSGEQRPQSSRVDRDSRQSTETVHRGRRDDLPQVRAPLRNRSARQCDGDEEARQVANKLLLQTERFKASTIRPKGMDSVSILPAPETPECNNIEDDEDFFHVACHINNSLKEKIE